MRAPGRADEHAVLEEVELDGQRAEADLRVARRRDVGVAVAHQRRDARQPDDDLVTRERGDAVGKFFDGALELRARRRVEEVPVARLHLARHVSQVLAPPLRLGPADRAARRVVDPLGERGRGAQEHAEEDPERGEGKSEHVN